MEFRGKKYRSYNGPVWVFRSINRMPFPAGFTAFDRDTGWHAEVGNADHEVWIVDDLAVLVAIDYLLERGWTMRKDACDTAFLALYQSTQCESVT